MYFKRDNFKQCSLSQISSSLENSMPERGRGYKTTPANSILCSSQIRVEADIRWCKIVLHAPGPDCYKASFRYFPSGSRLPDCSQQCSQTIVLWGCSATLPNKYKWFKWVLSSENILAWNRTCWCKFQSFLNSVHLFRNAAKVSTEKYGFPSKKIYIYIFL